MFPFVLETATVYVDIQTLQEVWRRKMGEFSRSVDAIDLIRHSSNTTNLFHISLNNLGPLLQILHNHPTLERGDRPRNHQDNRRKRDIDILPQAQLIRPNCERMRTLIRLTTRKQHVISRTRLLATTSVFGLKAREQGRCETNPYHNNEKDGDEGNQDSVDIEGRRVKGSLKIL